LSGTRSPSTIAVLVMNYAKICSLWRSRWRRASTGNGFRRIRSGKQSWHNREGKDFNSVFRASGMFFAKQSSQMSAEAIHVYLKRNEFEIRVGSVPSESRLESFKNL